MTTCGIFGFNFTRAFEAHGLKFQPLYRDPVEARKRAHDREVHQLTGTVSGTRLQDSAVPHRLGAVLSFMERLDVRLSEPTEDGAATSEPVTHFGEVMRLGERSPNGGEVIAADHYNPHREARRDFIERAMAHLADDKFCEETKFRLLLIKAAETCRQRSPFLEVSYFLLMSGLEAFARAMQKDTRSSAQATIARTLAGYGFKVSEDNPKNLPRAISTYVHLRNAIFHNGELTKKIDLGHSNSVTVNGEDYLLHLQMLVCFTVMKVVGFEDALRNWDGWFDFHPYGNFGQHGWDDFLATLAARTSSEP